MSLFRKAGLGLVLLSVVVLNSACYSVSVRSAARSDARPVHSTGLHFVFGLTPANITAPECSYGVSRVETKRPWWDVLLVTPFTVGLVSASSVEYECAEPPPPAQVPGNAR